MSEPFTRMHVSNPTDPTRKLHTLTGTWYTMALKTCLYIPEKIHIESFLTFWRREWGWDTNLCRQERGRRSADTIERKFSLAVMTSYLEDNHAVVCVPVIRVWDGFVEQDTLNGSPTNWKKTNNVDCWFVDIIRLTNNNYSTVQYIPPRMTAGISMIQGVSRNWESGTGLL